MQTRLGRYVSRAAKPSGRGDGDLSGYSVAAVGDVDVNGDGFDDVVLISSPPCSHADGRSASGVSYVVYGNASRR